VVESLQRDGLIVSQEVQREGRRPERTVYALTEVGRVKFAAWHRELMSKPAKEYTQFAAALSFIGLVNHDRVILDTFATDLVSGMPSVRGRSQMWRVVQYLDQLKASGSSNLTEAARSFAIKHSGKGVVVVISDFLDKHGYEDALRYLVARNLDIYVIHVLSREEVEPELVGDLRLVDAEDDDEAEITVSAPLLKRYKDNLNAFVGGLKDWCTKRGIAYIFTTNQNPFDKLILNYLRERGLVR